MKKLLAITAGLILTAGFAWGQAGQPAAPALSAEATLCASVSDREPVGAASNFPAEVGNVCLWTRVTGGAGEMTIHHLWLHDGKQVADVELTIKGNSWRTWSCKKVPASWTGNWEVRVTDAGGNVLKSVTFTVGGAATGGQ
jgi:hypothetical protein